MFQILTELEYDTGRSTEVGIDVSHQCFMEEKNNENDYSDNHHIAWSNKENGYKPSKCKITIKGF